MQSEQFDKLRSWFTTYSDSYRNGDAQLEDAVRLKYEHTMRVCSEMEELCGSLGIDGTMKECARIAALFHDVARFEQFRIYRTFSDKKSENHAEMGETIIRRHKLFDVFGTTEKEMVLAAIRHHNAIAIPSSLDDDQTLLCRMLRDADKLDIYKIALDYYVNPDPARRETVQVGIPDGAAVTPEVCGYVIRRKLVPYEIIRTVADFRMIQLGWVFDLNFPHSLQCVKKREYVAAIKKFLPASPHVAEAVDAVERYLETV